MYGYHGKRDISGTPGPWNPGPPVTADPLHTSVTTHTLMFNAYYDLGKWMDRFVPYVGAGVGVAYNRTDDVYFTGNPALINRIEGDDRWSLAWSLMAGVGWQVTERVTLDFGYRYLDMGKAESGHIDTAGFWNPKVRLDDLTAHEIKFGLRFAFGGGDLLLRLHEVMLRPNVRLRKPGPAPGFLLGRQNGDDGSVSYRGLSAVSRVRERRSKRHHGSR